MDKAATLERIGSIGVVPVVRASSADEAMQAIDAIREGGVNVLEITMTVPGAVGVIAEISKRYGDDVVVGAGTVLDPETALRCIDAGAVFVVSPALNLDTIAACINAGIPVMPGALSPTEVVTAWNAGADMVKIFPAGAVGGPSYLKNLKGPLPHIKMIPTGGVSLATAADFIKAGAAALGVGTDLVDIKAIREGRPEVVTERARQFVEIVKETRG
ncbi:MAG TPA: bifunctional 4-hydroxy-2-oxoglutarate aldolase/2-dehydro-3-deoxy-phosphogluconate aldolase [Pyrinomonadaceae bacterium]|jgi:2-dehydro-3-deoxyphosphogluconate aldolase/(4S)-4-hydroxy-2-oxoglutarate aldolase